MTLLIAVVIISAFILFSGKAFAKLGPCTKKYPTPEEIAEEIMPQSQVRGTPGFTQVIKQGIIDSARQGRIVGAAPPCPSGQQTTGQQILGKGLTTGLSVGSKLGLGLVGLTGTALGAATLGLGFLAIPLFGIFSHHAKAVARENTVLCDVIPSVNQLIAAIVQAYREGQFPPTQAIEKLQELEGSALSALQPIMKRNASQCNAACVFATQVEGAIRGSIATIQKEACL